MANNKNLWIAGGILILLIAALIWWQSTPDKIEQPLVTNFEECAAAGYPIMESYPRQCRTPEGRTFTEDIQEWWKTDDIRLLKIPETGEITCFGCGKMICKDPIAGLEEVEETPERYCDEYLEIVEK